MVTYTSIKVLPEAKRTLDKVKLRYEVPSYTQAVTLLARQENFREEFVQTVTPEISRIILTELYKLFLHLISQVNKTPNEITLKDFIDVARSIESSSAQK